MTKRKTQPKTIKRAGIYIRVSSELQAKTKNKKGEDEAKISPKAQEADCRALCESRGYQVHEVYRDTSKYRVGRKLVEPSGTRADRPGLRAILAAARASEIDVIVAWREDRLYRGYRPMLDVLETLDETGIDIELAKETFDKKIAPVKAWAAKMELDAKHDRFTMGVAGRLQNGKVWNIAERYGYRIIDGVFQVAPDEAEWIVKIKQWYADGVSVWEIRKRLNAGGAPMKEGGRFGWRDDYVYRILRRDYSASVFTMRWDGETHEFPIEPITDKGTEARVLKRRTTHKAYRAGNLKAQSLAAGLVHCEACGRRMYVKTKAARGVRRIYYACPNGCRGYKVAGCARYVRLNKIDDEVWRKTWELISTPGELARRINQRVAELQAEHAYAAGDVDRLTKELDDLFDQRQWVITMGRTKKIMQEDMETQLAALDWQQASAQAELSKAQLATGDVAARLVQIGEDYRADVLAGAEEITREPETAEQAQRIFETKRRIVSRLVQKASVKPDKSVDVEVLVDLSEAMAQPAERMSISNLSTFSQVTDRHAYITLTL